MYTYAQTPDLRIHSSCRLMDHFVAGTPVRSEGIRRLEFVATEDEYGQAILLNIGEESGRLYLTRQVKDTETGWERIDLTESLRRLAGPAGAGAYQRAQTLAIQHGRTEGLTLAVVLSYEHRDGLAVGQLDLSSRAATVNWYLAPSAQDAAAPERLAKVSFSNTLSDERLLVHPHWVSGQKHNRYIVDITLRKGGAWQPIELPEFDRERAVRTCIGITRVSRMGKVPYLFVLGHTKGVGAPHVEFLQVGGSKSWRSDSLEGDAADYCLAPHGGAVRLITPGGEFLSAMPGDGRHVKLNRHGGEDSAAWLVDAKELRIARQPLTSGGWVRTDNDEVLFLSTFGNGPSPTLMTDVVGMAPMLGYRGNQRKAVFVVNSERMITRLEHTRDAGGWCSERLRLPLLLENGSVASQKVRAHTVRLTVQGPDGAYRANAHVFIRASERGVFVVNGRRRILDPTLRAVQTDHEGCIDIVEEISTYSGARFEICASRTGAPVCVVDGYEEARGQVMKLTSIEALQQDIKDDHGQSLGPLAEGSCSDLEEFIKGMKQLEKVEEKSEINRPEPRQLQGLSWTPAARFVLPGPDSPLETSSLSVSIFSTLADGLRYLAGAVKRAVQGLAVTVSEAIDGVVQIAVGVGRKVVKFFVDTFRGVVDAVVELLRIIKAGAQKVWNYLKFLFNWSDIKNTQQALKESMLATLESQKEKLKGIKRRLPGQFDKVPKLVDTWRTMLAGMTVDEMVEEGEDEKGVRELLHSSQANVMNSHLRYLGDTPFYEQKVVAELRLVLEGWKLSGVDWNKIQPSVRTFMSQLEKGHLTTKALIAAIFDLLSSSIDAMKEPAMKLLDLAIELVDALIKVILQPITIPIVSDFLKEWFDFTMPSLLDVICCSAAIPTTLVFKLTTGQAPFPRRQADWLEVSRSGTGLETLDTSSSLDGHWVGYAQTGGSDLASAKRLASVLKVAASVLRPLRIAETVVLSYELRGAHVRRCLGPLYSGLSLMSSTLDLSANCLFELEVGDERAQEFLEWVEVLEWITVGAETLVFALNLKGDSTAPASEVMVHVALGGVGGLCGSIAAVVRSFQALKHATGRTRSIAFIEGARDIGDGVGAVGRAAFLVLPAPELLLEDPRFLVFAGATGVSTILGVIAGGQFGLLPDSEFHSKPA